MLDDLHRQPEWCAAEVCTWSLYLGFAQGPGREDHSWDKPLSKYAARVGMWSCNTLGMHYTAKVYNAFAFSTLSFVWQITDVPSTALDAEKIALSKLTPGPGMWRVPADLFYLREFFGQTMSFRSVKHVALAAQLRVAVMEDLSLTRRVSELKQAFADTNHLDRLVQWHSWYSSSHLLVLDRALDAALALGVDPFKIHRELVAQRPHSSRVKLPLQKELTSLLLKARSFNSNLEQRLRHKMQRWQLATPPGILSRRLPNRLLTLRGVTTPRVQAAVFRTLWNGWTTAARFQRTACCVLACSPTAEDRIEHYCKCPFFVDLTRTWLGLPARLSNLAGFLLSADGMGDKELALMAVAVYAMHRATAHFRRAASAPHPDQVRDFLQTMCQNAVRGHKSSLLLLDEAVRGRYIVQNIRRGSDRSRSPRRRSD